MRTSNRYLTSSITSSPSRRKLQQDLKVFPLEELLAALEQYVEEFLAVPNKYIP